MAVPPGLPLRDLTTDALATALRHATTDPTYAHRAHGLADDLRTEDKVTPVLDTLRQLTG